jgi:hypothetical protein
VYPAEMRLRGMEPSQLCVVGVSWGWEAGFAIGLELTLARVQGLRLKLGQCLHSLIWGKEVEFTEQSWWTSSLPGPVFCCTWNKYTNQPEQNK